jgi:hypothetical protein
MTASQRLLIALSWLCLTALPTAPAEAFRLEPYKDELFSYPAIIGSDFGGDYLVVSFDHQRDVIARDEKPDEKTRAEYVSLDFPTPQTDLVLRRDGETVRYVGIGRTEGNAEIVAIFLHGLGASRFDGMNDWRSGGNLNRIKNLMVRNGGVYLSADYAWSKRKAKRQIAALINAYTENSPGAPVILICASAGARPCWELLDDPATAARIDGAIMIAGISDSGFARSATVRDPARWVPIYMAHGNNDRRVSWRRQEKLFRQIKKIAPAYPIKLAVFDTGTHRAPLRMTDWRLAINWMLEVDGD